MKTQFKPNPLVLKYGSYAVGIFLGYQFILKPLLEKIGIVETEKGKGNIAFGLKYLSPTWWIENRKKGYLPDIFKMPDTKKFVKEIKDSIGTFSDDEDKLYNAFRQFTNKAQISYLAQLFSSTYNEDLFSKLQSNLNEKEFGIIKSIVESLPDGYYRATPLQINYINKLLPKFGVKFQFS